MQAFEDILILLAAVLISNFISQRFPRISTPLIQIALGIFLVLIPFVPLTGNPLDPEIFMILFIAPLLFYDTRKADKAGLWRLRRPVLSLAIGLVFATCLAVGFITNWLVPSIPLAAALAFGAALAPTDVVAVLSMKGMASISAEQDHLLEGEALLNDAASIVAFQFAIAAVMTSTFSLLDAGLSFILMFVGGIAVGIVLMFVRSLIVRAVAASGIESSTFHVLFEIITPCLVFLVAEWLHVSGIIAVVAAGITYSLRPRANSPVSARNLIVSSSVWSVVTFTINGLVFLMLGAALPQIGIAILERHDINFSFLGLSIVAIMASILLIRFIWILIMHRNVNLACGGVAMAGHTMEEAAIDTDASSDTDPKASLNASSGANPTISSSAGFTGIRNGLISKDRKMRNEALKGLQKRRTEIRRLIIQDEAQKAHADPNYWKLHLFDALQLMFAGPKGAITLALIFTIPLIVTDGSPFPERNIILFVAAGVILLSLLLTNIVLPIISPKKAEKEDPVEVAKSRTEILRKVIHDLLEYSEPKNKAATDEVIRQYYLRIIRLKNTGEADSAEEHQLRTLALIWERHHTLELIQEKYVSSFVGTYYLSQLSRRFARLEHSSGLVEGWKMLLEQLKWRFSPRFKKHAEQAHINNPDYTQDYSHQRARNQLFALQRENTEFVLSKLQNLAKRYSTMDEPPISPNLINDFIADFIRQLERMDRRLATRNRVLPTVSKLLDHEQLKTSITRMAFSWEREAISTALREDKISRVLAKEMLDNVSAMELDIEEFLE
ncbi:MAG: sodium:proton antiporter [Coriobacteriales bacterium]|nr:sodium:proton antiporter [Coriobacteriales bacterium]